MKTNTKTKDRKPGNNGKGKAAQVVRTTTPAKEPEAKHNGSNQPPGAYHPNQIAPEIFFEKHKGQYWRKTLSQSTDSEYVPCDEKNLKRHFKLAGFEVERDSQISQLTTFEWELCRAQNHSSVDRVISLAGHKAGLFTHGSGTKFLIPRGPTLIQPKSGAFEHIDRFLTELVGEDQMDFVLSWLKIAIEDLRSLNPYSWHQSQLLALAGEANCGKSFFQILITMLLGGRKSDPYLWMVGKSNFNDDLAESEHLAMEDKEAARNMASRSKFASSIKQLTATSETPIHGKGKQQFIAPCFHRMTLSLNDDPESITILPPLSQGVTDKIILVKCSPATMVDAYAENMARFKPELPAFTHFLMNVYRVPDPIKERRFGVKAYLNPALVEILEDYEPHIRLLEIIDGTFFQEGRKELIKGTSGEIQRRLTAGNFSDVAHQILTYSSACGQLLGKLAKENPSRFFRTKSNGERRWTLNPPKE